MGRERAPALLAARFSPDRIRVFSSHVRKRKTARSLRFSVSISPLLAVFIFGDALLVTARIHCFILFIYATVLLMLGYLQFKVVTHVSTPA